MWVVIYMAKIYIVIGKNSEIDNRVDINKEYKENKWEDEWWIDR